MKKRTAVLMAGALLAPAALLAQGPPAGQRGMGMGPRMGAETAAPRAGMFAPQMLLSRGQRLSLTDAQTKQLQTLADEVRKAHDEAAAAAKPREEKLRELWQADKPDVGAIQSEMQALMSARHTAALAAASATARAKGLLTAEQRGWVEGWADGRRMGARGFGRDGRSDGPPRGSGFRTQPRMRRF